MFGWRRLSRLVNHPLVLSTLFFAARMAERAPWISSVRKYASPRLLIPSSVGLPPLELWRGTRPSQAETCRPLSKLCASAIDATSAPSLADPAPSDAWSGDRSGGETAPVVHCSHPRGSRALAWRH